MKGYTDLEQSRKLAEILPTESADMRYSPLGDKMHPWVWTDTFIEKDAVPCWSLVALLSVLPEINGIPLTLEKVKAEDGYDGYYYHIAYEGKILIPYSKNSIDACYEMIIKLHEQNLL